MSGASNLGYGDTPPLSNVNPEYANAYGIHSSGGFSSNQTAGKSKSKRNIRKLKRSVKAITKRYKRMRAGSRRISRMKRKISSKFICSKCRRKNAHGRCVRRRRTLKGGDGYSQLDNNNPISHNVQMAGIHLPASQLGLANPAPYTATTNSVDNYNHYNNTAFASRGH